MAPLSPVCSDTPVPTVMPVRFFTLLLAIAKGIVTPTVRSAAGNAAKMFAAVSVTALKDAPPSPTSIRPVSMDAAVNTVEAEVTNGTAAMTNLVWWLVRNPDDMMVLPVKVCAPSSIANVEFTPGSINVCSLLAAGATALTVTVCVCPRTNCDDVAAMATALVKLFAPLTACTAPSVSMKLALAPGSGIVTTRDAVAGLVALTAIVFPAPDGQKTSWLVALFSLVTLKSLKALASLATMVLAVAALVLVWADNTPLVVNSTPVPRLEFTAVVLSVLRVLLTERLTRLRCMVLFVAAKRSCAAYLVAVFGVATLSGRGLCIVDRTSCGVCCIRCSEAISSFVLIWCVYIAVCTVVIISW